MEVGKVVCNIQLLHTYKYNTVYKLSECQSHVYDATMRHISYLNAWPDNDKHEIINFLDIFTFLLN